jgi:hypothetical protein
MTQHKYAELLRYAADNADARFTSYLYDYDGGDYRCPIASVLMHSQYDDWKIYKEPCKKVEWYYKDDYGNLIRYATPDLNWYAKITYVDGKPTKTEFAE